MLGFWRPIPIGQLLLGCCSGICARQTLAFTQTKPECNEQATRQVQHVNGMKEAGEITCCTDIIMARQEPAGELACKRVRGPIE